MADPSPDPEAAEQAEERAAIAVRQASRKLVAFLAARSGDIAGAEDALADAVCAALEHWPQSGVPRCPEAWLLAVARRRLIDQARHRQVADAYAADWLALSSEAMVHADEGARFPDERLRLMFVCAHPAIDPGIRSPLMLQTVLGLDAGRIASAFLTKPATMGQRLSRAKQKIQKARIPFAIPASAELPERLGAVAEAVYAAFTCGGAPASLGPLGGEAFTLAALLVELLPEEPEALALLALMQYHYARHPPSRGAPTAYLPLSAQDPGQWCPTTFQAANRLLAKAASHGRLGRFQIEAAIQQTHMQGRLSGREDWAALTALYQGLLAIAPTLGAAIAAIAVQARAESPAAALAALDRLPAHPLQDYQPHWALRAQLLADCGRGQEARQAYDRAIALCTDPATRTFLQNRRDRRDG
ncbi:RNA polymerase sigma factor [Denitratisoma sp. agr-D3]